MRRACLICTLALVVVTGIAGAQSTAERARQARAQLQALRAKIEQVRESIAQGREQHEELAEKLAEAGRAVRRTAERLAALEQRIAELQQQVARLKRRRDAERARLEEELETLRAQVRAAYRTGHTNKLRLLLSGENPARLGRMLVYYEYFTRARSQQIARLRDILAELAARQSALEAKRRQLADKRAARAAVLARLQQRRAQRKAALAALEAQLSAQKATLADYRRTANQLEDLLGALEEKLSRPPATAPGSFTALKGRMRPPVNGPILARFGAPKANGKLQWQGQWRAAPPGTPVHAVAPGRVVYVGYMHHYGLIVVLEHAGEYFTVYGHIKSSYVTVGEHISRGQVIALAGSSGGHKRSGVYFEIRRGRQPLDPSAWFRG